MKTKEEILKGCEHDGSYIPVSEVKRLMEEYAEQFKIKKPHDCHGKGYEVRDNIIYCRECMKPLFDIIPDMKP